MNANEESGVLSEPERLFVAFNTGRSGLDKFPLVLQLERFDAVHKALEEIDKSSFMT